MDNQQPSNIKYYYKSTFYTYVQLDIITNEIIRVFSSAKEAALSLGKQNGSSQIIQVCNKYIKPCGRRVLSAFGYKWKYLKDIEGSTTNEKASQDETE